jgi:hypothetical protein
MKKALLVLFGLLAGFSIPLLISPDRRSELLNWLTREPLYEGKPFCFWVEALRSEEVEALKTGKGVSPELCHQAIRVIADIGPEAAPALSNLLALVKTKDLRRTTFYSPHPLPPGVKPPTEFPLEQLVKAIWQIDPEGKVVVPDLVETIMLRKAGAYHEEGYALIPEALREMPPKAVDAAVPLLVAKLQDQEPRVRQNATNVLGMLVPQAKAAVPALLERLTDPDQRVRELAHSVLQRLIIGEESAALPTIIGFLDNPDSEVRHKAFLLLRQIGSKASKAVPALISALTHTDPRMRLEAAEALSYIGRAARDAIPALRARQNDPDEEIQEAAEQALKCIDRP